MQDTSRQEFAVSDLPTKSVAFHPEIATITREFPSGPYTITINGIHHEVNIDSIHVESTGSAKVIDIQHGIINRKEPLPRKASSGNKAYDPVRDLGFGRAPSCGCSEALRQAQDMLGQSNYENAYMGGENQYSGFNTSSARPLLLQSCDPVWKGEKPSVEEGWIQTPDPEKLAFYPKQFCQVVVHLEGQRTPVSVPSTETTVGAARGIQTEGSGQNEEVMLHLSYTVRAMSDLRLHNLSIDTPSSSAKIRLCALFTNMTSETWQDAQVTLSVSQAHVSRLEQKMPSLQPWEMCARPTESIWAVQPILPALGTTAPRKPFPDLSFAPTHDFFDTITRSVRNLGGEGYIPLDSEVPESISQGYGLSVAYELPGRRVIMPSFAPRRHEIAELDLKTVSFTYVIVPKKHAAAFLRARIQNDLPVIMSGGEVNVTVDGTCFGRTKVSTCPPKGSFELNLGVDRFIQVTYNEPGITEFRTTDNAEHITYLKASCKVKNTRTWAADVLVLDQVPVSVDDSFQVDILTPVALKVPGIRWIS
ncbi:hypothetical protein AbraIFM66951_010997 [Aspergillus brasiliensis]|uniref:DUF4139 domain-containing protein n=1 Tax=Aspergillus brasiliensis TaxID=319629 RepID=A0A9W6DLR9_9EURO|nr:hypothetical protein AbraCBS73388_003858 [Aspergillus brasiliensis]GKZ41716.1 hypothetical protein AbraIFM66951_010997 [Aspergillus brasiliensis]